MNRILASMVGHLPSGLSNTASILVVDQPFIDNIPAVVNFTGGDYFYLTLQEGYIREIVKVTGKGSNFLGIVRAQGGTTIRTFTPLATYSTELNEAYITDIAAGLPPVSATIVTGANMAAVTQSPVGTFNVNVPYPVIQGISGIEVSRVGGTWQVGLSDAALCCGDGTIPGVGGVSIVGAGIAAVALAGGIYTVTVPTPNFTGAGVSVTGSWPDLVFTASGGGGGGTVISVDAGIGISITGAPDINPTINITNTLASAYSCDDIDFNAGGQATRIENTFNPISTTIVNAPLTQVRTGSSVVLSVTAAAEGVVGVVALADSAVALDPTDVTTAVTPKMLSTVIADLAGGSLLGSQSYTGEADSAYTITVPTTAFTLTLAVGQRALVVAALHVRSSSAPTVAQNYGMAVFSGVGPTRIQSSKLISQNQQTMSFYIDGPFTDTLVLKTTALSAPQEVVSFSLTAMVP